jgi:hypothetical protein
VRVRDTVSSVKHIRYDRAKTETVVAFSVDCATAALAIIAATSLRFILVHLNNKLDRGEYVEGAINSGAGIPSEAVEKGFRFLI